jgi:hypothetical protein
MSVENHGGKISRGKNSRFIHQSYLSNLLAELLRSKGGGTAKEMMNFVKGNILFQTSKGF